MMRVHLIRSHVARLSRLRHCAASSAVSSKSSSSSSVDGIGTKLQNGRQSTAAATANGVDDKFNFPRPEFDNAPLIYAGKSTAELIRAYLVFGACSLDVLVNNQTKVVIFYELFLCLSSRRTGSGISAQSAEARG